MRNVVNIPVEVRSGRLKIINRTLYDRVVDSLKEGKVYVLKIEPQKKETVSDPMRRYYWSVVVAMIAEETGHSKDMIHEALKIKILSYVDERTGLTIVPSVFSDNSKMDIQEKKAFIDEVKRWAFDFLNISIPDPQTVVH
jgi:hypothetical protein